MNNNAELLFYGGHRLLESPYYDGRLLVDIMGDVERRAESGGLYSFYGGRWECLQGGTTVANGISLSADESMLYFTDSVTREVWEYDYDIDTGVSQTGVRY